MFINSGLSPVVTDMYRSSRFNGFLHDTNTAAHILIETR